VRHLVALLAASSCRRFLSFSRMFAIATCVTSHAFLQGPRQPNLHPIFAIGHLRRPLCLFADTHCKCRRWQCFLALLWCPSASGHAAAASCRCVDEPETRHFEVGFLRYRLQVCS
jgi:hypothetical protein